MKSDNFKIRFLGSSGGKAPQNKRHCVCIYIPENILIDAGNIFTLKEEEIMKIDSIVLSHSHLDHILEIPFLIDYTFENRKNPIKIYGLSETINALKQHIFNDIIWPNFNSIKLNGSEYFSVEYIEIKPFEKFNIGDYEFLPIPVKHTVPTVGFIVRKNEHKFFYTSDNYITSDVLNVINSYNIDAVFIDISFPSSMEKLAVESFHNSTSVIKEIIERVNHSIKKIYVIHIKPYYEREILREIGEIQTYFDDKARILPLLEEKIFDVAIE